MSKVAITDDCILACQSPSFVASMAHHRHLGRMQTDQPKNPARVT